ncbi:hypothetical protein DYB30_010629 [Aphanomyces astaci]|uniref:Uncharacterized protein n=2 Tax=Aphanomyces astaci TaxID=112090 RepID=A0A397CVS3_APHAT|nr:hypothetical protein DYB30_010629 [Aphanomyces astaci]RHY81545.1 hypothetical protein DYB26_007737 [Aphanomyces astaci]
MATTVQGRRGWVRAYTSVDVDSCRPSANDRDDAGGRGGYVRGHHLCSGYVVMESTTKPGFLHVRLAMQCTFHAKDAASIKALAAKCQHLAALDLRLRSCRLTRLSFTGSRRTEMDVIEVESTDVDVSRDDAALGALFNDIKQRCSMVLAEVDPQSRVTKADAASLWPQPLHSHPFQRLSQFTEPLSQFVEPSLLQFEPHVVQVQHSSHSAKGRRTSSVHKQATDRRRRHSTLIMHDGSSDDGGSYMRPATRTLLEDDDMARQIYQNRQSVLQII